MLGMAAVDIYRGISVEDLGIPQTDLTGVSVATREVKAARRPSSLGVRLGLAALAGMTLALAIDSGPLSKNGVSSVSAQEKVYVPDCNYNPAAGCDYAPPACTFGDDPPTQVIEEGSITGDVVPLAAIENDPQGFVGREVVTIAFLRLGGQSFGDIEYQMARDGSYEAQADVSRRLPSYMYYLDWDREYSATHNGMNPPRFIKYDQKWVIMRGIMRQAEGSSCPNRGYKIFQALQIEEISPQGNTPGFLSRSRDFLSGLIDRFR